MKWLISILLIVCLVVVFSQYQRRQWFGQERFTIINVGRFVEIESFDPSLMSGVRLKLPPDMEITGVGGRGVWRVAVMSELARKWGDKWAADSIADTLGISYVQRNWWDKIAWWQKQRNVDFKSIDLITRMETAPDGIEVRVLGQMWPSRAGEVFNSANISRLGLNITVVNQTGVVGLANHAANVIEVAGAKVSKVTTETGELDKCVLEGRKQERDDVGGWWLMKTFGCEWKLTNENGTDVVLRLGKDYLVWWKGN